MVGQSCTKPCKFQVVAVPDQASNLKYCKCLISPRGAGKAMKPPIYILHFT